MRIYAYRIRLNKDGYESTKHGQYYGVGEPLYRVTIKYSIIIDEDDIIIREVRAYNREQAITKVKVPLRIR